MKLKLFILFSLFCLQGYSQSKYILSSCSHATIKKNKVFKCLEYEASDSINYFKVYPNGLYTFFDEKGYKIEENSYSYRDKKEHEFKVIYLYDNKEKEIMWLWYDNDTNILTKISRVVVNNFDSTGKLTGSNDFTPYNYYEPNMAYIHSNDLNDDSIIVIKGNQKRKTENGFYGKDRKDTVYKRTWYYSHNRLDSEKTEGIEYNWCKLTRFKFTYKDSILSEITRVDDPYGDKHTNTEKTFFSENGLPMVVYKSNWDIKTKARYESEIKFRYTFWH